MSAPLPPGRHRRTRAVAIPATQDVRLIQSTTECGDDECLSHLLQALGVDNGDRDLGEYPGSFLTA